MTPIVLTALLLAPAEPPSGEPKPVPATRDELKAALETSKTARPRLPAPPVVKGERGVNNGRFRAYYLPEFSAGRSGREPDPAMTLDNTFKVMLFWITSRANNCYY